MERCEPTRERGLSTTGGTLADKGVTSVVMCTGISLYAAGMLGGAAVGTDKEIFEEMIKVFLKSLEVFFDYGKGGAFFVWDRWE